MFVNTFVFEAFDSALHPEGFFKEHIRRPSAFPEGGTDVNIFGEIKIHTEINKQKHMLGCILKRHENQADFQGGLGGPGYMFNIRGYIQKSARNHFCWATIEAA